MVNINMINCSIAQNSCQNFKEKLSVIVIGKKVAYVKNARYDACSRNVFRYNDLKDAVRMGRKKDHYIFKIESVGALPPQDLFIEAVKILRNKCRMFIDQLSNAE